MKPLDCALKHFNATKNRYFSFALIWLFTLSACASFNAPLAKNVAQPNSRPVRNFTSFSASLRCLDKMLAAAKRPQILISSTGFRDLSKKINVGADEMLVNAVNQTNIKSRAYLFLDQSFEKDFGQMELLTKSEDRKLPRLYFRGAITQVDANTVNDKFKVDLDLTNTPNPPTVQGGALRTVAPNFGKGVSIVSVDMHLVSFPDKTVLPGGSVANSMVVTNKAFGAGAAGLIKLTGYNMTLSFNRVESVGQAVRNLIELGTIELLGRYAKVPYWQCLNIEPTNEKLENKKRTEFTVTPGAFSVSRTQKMLSRLGYFSGTPDGQMDKPTHAAIAKFQAAKDLIATGDLNYDTYTRLVQQFKGYPENGYKQPAKRPVPTAGKKPKTIRLNLTSSKSRYRLNDMWVSTIKSNSSGYLYCFYQSGTGDVLQILPKKPGIRLQVSPGYSRKLPTRQDGFSLKFQTAGQADRILCVLQDAGPAAASPFDGKFEMFGKIPVSRLQDIPRRFASTGKLNSWIMISEVANP
jgi:putative peptidoglycan binding protein/uncharacterized protein DUF4384